MYSCVLLCLTRALPLQPPKQVPKVALLATPTGATIMHPDSPLSLVRLPSSPSALGTLFIAHASCRKSCALPCHDTRLCP